MRRTDRLFDIIQILRDGKLHRAQDIADRLEVSVRTIYRDMDTLVASGVPVEGERGVGYMVRDQITLPPAQPDAGRARGPEPRHGHRRRGRRPRPQGVPPCHWLTRSMRCCRTETVAEADAWKFAVYPFADAARGFGPYGHHCAPPSKRARNCSLSLSPYRRYPDRTAPSARCTWNTGPCLDPDRVVRNAAGFPGIPGRPDRKRTGPARAVRG